jgi:putative nucleotidyltransferase with HDIG domain
MLSSLLTKDYEKRPPSIREASIPLGADNTRERRLTSQQQTLALRIYGALLALGAVAFSSILLSRGYHFGPLVPTVITAAVALLCERLNVRVSPHLEASVSFLPVIFAAVILGPISAMAVAFICLLGDVGRPWERWVIWTSSRCLVFELAGFAAAISSSTTTLSKLFVATLIASAIAVSGDSIATAITLSIRESRTPRTYLHELLQVSFTGMLVYVPVIAALAYAYTHISPWSAVVFVGPAFAAQRYFVLYREQSRATSELASAVAKLERVNLSFASALVTALDARDHYTAGHSATVAVYAHDIAKQLGLPEGTQKRAHLCGLLHDIGKIGVPTGVLEKEGPLKRVERQAIENHAPVGATILGRIEGYEEIAIAVRHHHERFDGTGYPEQRSGEDISELARLVAVADAYSAMTSDRPYRTALYREEARERLERGAGTQFDPEVVKAFVEVLERESESYAAGSDWDFEAEIGKLMAQEFGRSPALAGEASLV